MVMMLLTRRAEGPKASSPTLMRLTVSPAMLGSNTTVSAPGWLTSSLALLMAERKFGARNGSAAVPAWAVSAGLTVSPRVRTRYTAGARRSSRASRAGRDLPARPAGGRRLALIRETFGDMRRLLSGSGPVGKTETIFRGEQTERLGPRLARPDAGHDAEGGPVAPRQLAGEVQYHGDRLAGAEQAVGAGRDVQERA